MKKNIMSIIGALIVLALIILAIVLITNKPAESSLIFKKEYEALNGTKNKMGKEHRTIKISKNNPYVKIDPNEIVKKLENKETFYLYVGDPKCPWCRSVLETSIKIAKKYNIDTIYYIEIWDEEGNEIFRDKYEVKDGKAVKVKDGTEAYNTLLKSFNKVLDSYTLTDKDKTIEVGEKRIYAPNYFYVKDGEVILMVEGTSDKQEDPREELTKEMLKDEEEAFKKLFDQK